MLASLAKLDKRAIAHTDQLPAYAYVQGEMSEKGMGISIREYQDSAQDKQAKDRVRSEMRANGGGPLGIKYIKEIRIGYAENSHREAWNRFLSPAKGKDRWSLSDGPDLRLLKSDSRRVLAIVFRVHSLDTAIRHLKHARMLGKGSNTYAEISSERTSGVRILLEE